MPRAGPRVDRFGLPGTGTGRGRAKGQRSYRVGYHHARGCRHRPCQRGSSARLAPVAGDLCGCGRYPNQPGAPVRAGSRGRDIGPGLALVARHLVPAKEICGTRADPELDPEALGDIHANQARAMGLDGAGVTVAVLADGLNPASAEFVRNPAFGAAGARVITAYQDYSGDGTAAKTDGAEAFGDASSIAAQGNKVYNIAQYVNPDMASALPKSGCWVKVVGAAPGASLLVLKIDGQNNSGTVSGVVQAIQYAVQSGAKVINESFGSDPFPDTALDVVRGADDAAIAAGVTVVVSSGDAGITSTIGSPATDPNVISVGATTTFRSYAQSNFGGFYNPVVGDGTWVGNNIASLSSGGFNQAGGTVDLVAPGDSNWALCSTNVKAYTGCSDVFRGTDIGVQSFGGTSEAAPLTSAAAADVIEAYARAHGGADPSPALVKEILCSTATDIDAPAAEQGSGLLNVAGAVKLAESLPAVPPSTTTTTGPTTSAPTTIGPTTTSGPTTSTTGTSTTTTVAGSTTTAEGSVASPSPDAARPVPAITRPGALAVGSDPPTGSLLISPNQVNVVQGPGATTTSRLSVTNTAAAAITVRFSVRKLNRRVYDTGPGSLSSTRATPRQIRAPSRCGAA